MMESVLEGKIRERRRRFAVFGGKPAGIGRNVGIKIGHHQIVIFQKFLVLGRTIQSFLWQQSQHSQGVMVALAPGLQIQGRK